MGYISGTPKVQLFIIGFIHFIFLENIKMHVSDFKAFFINLTRCCNTGVSKYFSIEFFILEIQVASQIWKN